MDLRAKQRLMSNVQHDVKLRRAVGFEHAKKKGPVEKKNEESVLNFQKKNSPCAGKVFREGTTRSRFPLNFNKFHRKMRTQTQDRTGCSLFPIDKNLDIV